MLSEDSCGWSLSVSGEHLRYWTHPQSVTLSPSWSDLSSPQEWVLNERLLGPGTQRPTMVTEVTTGESLICNVHKHWKITWREYVLFFISTGMSNQALINDGWIHAPQSGRLLFYSKIYIICTTYYPCICPWTFSIPEKGFQPAAGFLTHLYIQ